MRRSLLYTLLAAASAFCAQDLPPRDYNTHDFYALELHPDSSPAHVAQHLGLEYDGPLGDIDRHHLFRTTKHNHDIVGDAVTELKRRRRKRDLPFEPSPLDHVIYHQKQKAAKRLVKRGPIPDPVRVDTSDSWSGAVAMPSTTEAAALFHSNLVESLEIQDPIFKEQWHLFNGKQLGNDLNVTGLWLEGITGANSTVCIVDDGLDMDSNDLKDNYFQAGSYDFNDHVKDPKPRLSDDRHGTRCAGEVAAVRNNVCGVGVAYDAKVAGVRILSGGITDADEALAMNYAMNENYIYSCSWGPPDDGASMDAPGILIKKAIVNGVQNGRHGKGSIYVFAAGNGAANDDNCNFDGYTNSIYSVTVGAITKHNQHPYYSEQCSAQLVVTYSSGPTDGIHTTDVGTDKCSSAHGGTSAAGPLAAAVYALVLSVRPDLTWRDVQWLTIETAVTEGLVGEWQDTPYGKYSHQFGYGKMDAYSIVHAAEKWELRKPQAWYFSPWMHVKHEVPQGQAGLASTFEVSKDMLKKVNLETIEHVTVTMNVEHTRRGDLGVELRSPSGVVSHLSTPRRHDDYNEGYVDWTFMSVAHWGEHGIGNWTVIVKDTNVNEHKGTFTDWRLRLYGECIDAKSQGLIPMPDEHEDDDHDVIVTPPQTTILPVPTATATASVPPTDSPDRPTKPKPTGTTTAPLLSTATAGFETPAEGAEDSTSDAFLPSPFPTFGVSKRTQIWIYGSLALIALFCASLAGYFWWARRKRLRNNPRSEYEFELVGDEDDDGDGANGAGAGRKGKRRAGELYDAFAGESDEDLFSESDDGYRDRDDDDEFDEKAGMMGRSGSGSGSGSGSSDEGRKRLK